MSGAPRPRRLRRVGGRTAGRTPFALLVVALLASGLIGLLMLNTALDQGSFALSRLQRQTSQYTQEQQSLQQQIDRESAPGELAARARQLGMVPGGDPAFLADGGRVLGTPSRVAGPPVRVGAGDVLGAASATPSGSASPGAGAGASAAAVVSTAPSAAPSGSASATAGDATPGAVALGGGLTLTASTPPAVPTPMPTVVH